MTNNNTAGFFSIIEGEKSIYDFILECLKENKEIYLPDDDSLQACMPEIGSKEIRFVDGMLDSIVPKNKENVAQTLYDMIKEFGEYNKEFGENTDDKIIDKHLGKIYLYLISHHTVSFIDDFLDMMIKDACEGNDEYIFKVCFFIANQYAWRAAHREVVKFAIAIIGLAEFDNNRKNMLLTLGYADEFGLFVSHAFKYAKDNESIFMLAKATKGWGRIHYIESLVIDDDKKREWLLLEGYKCDIGTDHVVLMCLEKGDLLGYIKENGFNDRIYDATGDMLDSFSGLGRVSFEDYPHSKELVELFVLDSKNREMNMSRFSNLLNLLDFIESSKGDNPVFSDEKRLELSEIIFDIAFESDISWEKLVHSDPLSYNARNIAKKIDIDIWDDIFAMAKKDSNIDEWFELSKTRDKKRWEKLIELVKMRFDLESLKTDPQDELGLDAKFDVYNKLSFIAQNMQGVEYSVKEIENGEVIGIEILDTLLQSPVTRCRNMTLNTIESWLVTPKSLIDVINKVIQKEPNESIKKRYEKLLQRHKDGKHEIIQQTPIEIFTE